MQKVKAGALFAVVCVALFGTLFLMGRFQPSLVPGDALPAETVFPVLLDGSSEAETSLILDGAAGTADLMAFGFMPHGSKVVLTACGREVAAATLEERNSLVAFATLDIAGIEGEVTVSVDGPENLTPVLFVDTGLTMRSVLDLSGFMGLFEAGMLAALAVWGLTLYVFKRSESYMRQFVMFVAVLFAQVLLFGHVWEGHTYESLYYGVSRCSVVATSMLAVDLCYRLADVKISRLGRLVLSAPGITLASLACAVATFFLWQSLGLAIDFAIYAGCAAAAVLGIFKSDSRMFFLPAVLLLSTLLCGCGTILGFLNLSRGFLYASLLTTPPLFNLPFVLVAMVVVNGRFAGKFNEAERLNVELDALVEERTRNLHEQENKRRQLMLNVFHDLRSPLFVLGNLARESESDAQTAFRNAPIVSERVSMLTRLTNDLFYLAKLEEGRIVFAEEAFPLDGLLIQTVDAWKTSAETSGASISLTTEEASVVGDEMRIKEALDNLIANAVRHSKSEGTIEISLYTKGFDAFVEVKDHGEGIRPEDLPDIFRQYYSKTSRGAERATGIGLSIAQESVARTGGDISASSVLGEGTTMTVRLPLLVHVDLEKVSKFIADEGFEPLNNVRTDGYTVYTLALTVEGNEAVFACCRGTLRRVPEGTEEWQMCKALPEAPAVL